MIGQGRGPDPECDSREAGDGLPEVEPEAAPRTKRRVASVAT